MNQIKVLVFIGFACMVGACGQDQGPIEPTDVNATTNEYPRLRWDASLWGNPRAGTAAMDKLSQLLSERTEGSWQLTLHYGEALSKARENLDGMAIGAFEVAMVCNFYHPQKNPALMVLTMPFLPMATPEQGKLARDAVYTHPAVIEEFARWNAMLYTSTYLPQYEFMGRGTPPATMEDWRGMTVRAGGGMGDAMLILGATPTSLTATEVYTGVQQGTMDAAAFPFTYSHVAYRIHEVSDWFTNGMAPGTADCPIVISKTAYDQLSPEYQLLLDEIKPEVNETQLQAYQDVDVVNLPVLREALVEVTYTKEMQEEMRNVVGRQVIDAWIEENQDEFDARGLVELLFEATGSTY